MFMKKLILFFCLSLFLSSCCNEDKTLIRAAVDNQMKNFPESTLQDLYKFFFQDYFGPGHIVSDSVAARNYLIWELKKMGDDSAVLLYESTGYKNNFVRVSLDVVRDSIVPFDVYLSAFLRSEKESTGFLKKNGAKNGRKYFPLLMI